MRLRNLEEKDAVRMLEWMHDESVVGKLQTNFAEKTMDDCLRFIRNSRDDGNIHWAIVDENDIYMGTVSLKHITDENAEFAITIHKDAMGSGCSIWAMKEVLRKGFEEYNLKSIYWCVAKDNLRALRFYDKNGFFRTDAKFLNITGEYTEDQINSYVWYQVMV